MSGSVAERLAGLDWPALGASLDEWGYARTPPLLTAAECVELRSLYHDESRFRSRVDMARFRFGIGEYKYLADPLPPLVAELREHAYPSLAVVAELATGARSTNGPISILPCESGARNDGAQRPQLHFSRANGSRSHKLLEPGRREEQEVIVLDVARIAQLVGNVSRRHATAGRLRRQPTWPAPRTRQLPTPAARGIDSRP